jgi:chromosome partitioning protein
MVISVLNQKGGVGKTTLAVHIATALAQQGNRILLVDADVQGSALNWSAKRDGASVFPVIGLPVKTIHRELPIVAANYDHAIIDGPPRIDDVSRSASMASNLVLIPIQPSPYDVWAAKEIVDVLASVAIYNQPLKTAFVVNRKIVNTAIGRDVIEALGEYPSIPVLKSQVCQRVAFAESAGNGLTVLETDPRGIASQEILSLVSELQEFAHA